MSSRRILSITSRKKVDNMLPVVVAEDNTTTVGPYICFSATVVVYSQCTTDPHFDYQPCR